MKLRDLIAGGLLAAFLVACSAASPAAPNASTGDLNATAAAGLNAANTAVPGLDATAASGAAMAATSAPGLQATAEAATGTTAGDLSAMLGQSVTVRGPVTEIVNTMLFTVTDPAIGDATGVLVMVPTGSFAVGQGQQVEVTGIMQQFDLAELERTLGVDIDDTVAANFSGRPVVIATQVNATTSQP